MKKILLIITVLISVQSVAQDLNYTKISARYKHIGLLQDSSLGVPAGDAFRFRGGGSFRAGQVFYDSTGADSGFYVSGRGKSWQRLARASESGKFGVSGQDNVATQVRAFDLGANSFRISGTDPSSFMDFQMGFTEGLIKLASRNISLPDGQGGILTMDGSNVIISSATSVGVPEINQIALEDGLGVQIESAGHTPSYSSRVVVHRDSIIVLPRGGILNIDSLRVWDGIADTLYKKPMTWDTRNGRWEYASNWWGGGGGGGGDVTKVGTPVNNQIGIWTGDGTIKGSTALTFDGNTLYTNAAATQGVLFQVAGLVPNYLMSPDATPGANEPYVMATHTSGYGILELSHGIGANFAIRNAGAGPLYLQSAASQSVILFPAATQMLTATSAGVGIGTATSPTARLHLPAGTASASTAPIKFTTGTDLSANEAGAVQFDGNFSLTKENAVKYGVGGNLTTNTTDVGNVGTGVDNLMTYSVPAGTLSQDGDYIEFTMTFTFAENSNSKQVKVMYGGTQIYGSGAQAQVGGSITVIGKVIRTGATSQKVTLISISGAALFVDVSAYTTATETLSGAVTLKGTGEAVSDDDIIQVITLVKFFPSN